MSSPSRSAPVEDRAAFRWVTDPEGVAALGEALRAAPAHAFDSESNSGFVYRERLCLLQFNVAERLWLVDLLALDDPQRDIAPLRAPLESDRHRTWLHGGEFDVGSLKRDFDLSIGGLWDTQQAATFLGWEKTGYGAVVEAVCGIELDKAYAHYDWGRRPVAQEPLRYALDDVRYLPRVATELERQVEVAGLTEELEIANETVMGATWSSPSVPAGIWRLKGVHKLEPSQLPRLVALWEWREAEAKRRDLPPGRLMHPEKLLALARRPARNEDEMRAVGLRGRSAAFVPDLLEVLEHAEAHPPRVPKRPTGQRQTPGESRRLKRLKEWRRTEAERRGVPALVVLPPTAMQHLARHGAGDLAAVPQLGARRIALYGATLADVCR
jgi:ribonuclease D